MNYIFKPFKLYLLYTRIYKYVKQIHPKLNMIEIFQHREELNSKSRGFEIGKRAAQGYNIYLTFGSSKTMSKDAEESYNRYAMAMKHYNQALCDKESFIQGYELVHSLG